MSVDNINHIVFCRHIFCNVRINHFALGLTFIDGFLHYTRAHSCHLWAMIGIDNGGYNVTTESGTDLIKQVLIMLPGLLFIVISNLKLGTIGGKS